MLGHDAEQSKALSHVKLLPGGEGRGPGSLWDGNGFGAAGKL